MRFRPRAIFFLCMIPCISITFVLMYWIISSSCLRDYNLMSKDHTEILLPRKWIANLSGSIEDSSQSSVHGISLLPIKTWLDVGDQELLLSVHHDINLRGKFQQQRMNTFCGQRFMSKERQYPEGSDLDAFHRHLMFDDRHRIIYCFIPKVGCTNLKRLMLYMGDHLPIETIDWPWVEDSIYLEPALKYASFLNKTLTPKEKLQRINDYYKFIIVRNPFERLVSGYRNKVEKPVRYDRQHNFPESVKIEILRMYRKAELKYWQLTYKKNPFNISVTFQEFIRFIVESNIPEVNEHFQPMVHICHPCQVRYNFYGNFQNISHDVKALIGRFKTNPKFYRDKSLHTSHEQTSTLMADYYNQLSYRDKFQLLSAWYDEILFYYTLYPSERDTHKHLLGFDIPIL